MRGRKLVWTEGLFVTQHHFQQLDAYYEELISQRFRAALPFDWGISELEIDDRALLSGQVRIVRLHAILPDGTPIALGDGQDDVIPPRPIDAFLNAQVRSLDVYVGIADVSTSSGNVDLDGKSGAITRYAHEQSTVFDYNTGTSEQPLQWARRNLRILFGGERLDSFVAVRIAQVSRNSAGAAMVREGFVPPVLRIGASPFLMAGFRRLLEIMAAKQRSLAETRRQRTEAAVEFQANDSAKFWLLHSLNVTIPGFAHLVDQGVSHPEDAYLALAQLIGQLCTFAVDGDPSTIPRFNYLELGETFGPMFQRAGALLDAVIAERFTEIRLTKREDGMYLGQIDDPAILRQEFFLTAKSSTIPELQIRDRLPKLTKIASWNQINSLLNSAVNGAKLDLEYRPPGALPVRAGVLVYKVNKTPEYWNDIAGTATIAIYQPVESMAIELSLYAVDPANLK